MFPYFVILNNIIILFYVKLHNFKNIKLMLNKKKGVEKNPHPFNNIQLHNIQLKNITI